MLYIVKLTSKEHGNVCTAFGDYDRMVAYADHNADRFSPDIRPATCEDIEARIAALLSEREAVDFSYQNSSWGSGPRYRAQLSEIGSELATLRSCLIAMSEAREVAA